MIQRHIELSNRHVQGTSIARKVTNLCAVALHGQQPQVSWRRRSVPMFKLTLQSKQPRIPRRRCIWNAR